MGFFDKIKQGLSKTASSISSVFTASELDDDFYDELEESLILADLGVDTTTKAVERLRSAAKERHLKTAEEARACLREILPSSFMRFCLLCSRPAVSQRMTSAPRAFAAAMASKTTAAGSAPSS